MIEILVNWITNLISSIGYIGVFVLMIMESMIFPVPSEVVMPFAGYLASLGRYDLFLVTLAGSFGTVVGSLISYYIGLYGQHFIRKHHKLLLLNIHHLDLTHNFFIKYGARAIFISRFIPVVRHLISIPAGIGKMNIISFIFYTFLGGFIWNLFLSYVGFKLGNRWTLISRYSKILDIFIIAAMVMFIIYFIYKKKFKKNVSEKPASHLY